jgi:hypothetical protein
MYDISVDDLRGSSVASLELIKKRIEAELYRRKSEERERLITEFRKAWGALKDTGIRVTYCDQYEDDITYLDDWDDFSFD